MIPLEWMPPLMFAGLVVFMIIGYPVAFSLAAVGFFFGFLSIEMGYFTMAFMQAIPGRVFGSILSNELLLAIPFFTFMGAILEKCGLAEDMLESMGQLFGPIKGGLGYSTIIVGFILGAITGTVAAQVIAMALITLPVMMRYKYDMRYATGVLAASGTITQLVPPSLVLVVLADQLGRSVGDMYLGAWGPSLLQIAIFAAYTFYLTLVKPAALPPVPRTLFGKALLIKSAWGIIPAAVLIFLVLGTIMMGLATPTEAGAMGTIGAIVLAVVRNAPLSKFDRVVFGAGCAAAVIGALIGITAFKSVPFKIAFTIMFAAVAWLCWRAWQFRELRELIVQAFQATMRITAMVAFILVGATCFSITFQGVDGNQLGRAPDVRPAGRRLGLPDRRQPVRVLPGLLPRLLRDRLHHRADAGAGGAEAADARGRRRCGADLVRRHDLRQRADLVHAPAVRLRPLLPAQRRAQGGEELGHLLGLDSLGVPAAHHGGDRDLRAAGRDRLPRQAARRRSQQGQDRDPGAAIGRRAATGLRRTAEELIARRAGGGHRLATIMSDAEAPPKTGRK